VRVGITSVAVDYVDVDGLGGARESKDKLLLIRLRIENVSQTRKVEYLGWGAGSRIFDGHAPKLKDNFGNTYRRIDFGLATHVRGQVSSESIHPGKGVDDVIVFEAPINRVQFLRLELPASAVGEPGKLRFQIPRAMVFAKEEAEAKQREAEAKRKAEEAEREEAEAKRIEEARKQAEADEERKRKDPAGMKRREDQRRAAEKA